MKRKGETAASLATKMLEFNQSEEKREKLHTEIRKMISELTELEIKSSSGGNAEEEMKVLEQLDKEAKEGREAKRRRLEEEKDQETKIRASMIQSVELQKDQLQLQTLAFDHMKKVDEAMLDLLRDLVDVKKNK